MCIYLEIVRKLSSAKVTLRPQNVEHVIWQRYLTGLTNPLKRFFISYSVKRLKRFEETMAEKVDAIIPLTENDAAIFRPHANRAVVSVVPMGYNLDKLAGYDYNKQYAANPSFYHLASMDWLPNVEAVEWFFNEVAERVIGMHPEIRIHIAGRKMPDRFLRKTDKNLIVEPAVEDPVHWQEDKTVMIVPLHSGSGIRAKIIEGLALGKTIISTTTGAQGIACAANENILIADTPEAFVNQMSRCFLSKALCKQLGNNAKKLSSEKYEYKSCAAEMMKIYERSGNFHS
jgi:glycosyltransferase involved in cell wall biosynthesis